METKKMRKSESENLAREGAPVSARRRGGGRPQSQCTARTWPTILTPALRGCGRRASARATRERRAPDARTGQDAAGAARMRAPSRACGRPASVGRPMGSRGRGRGARGGPGRGRGLELGRSRGPKASLSRAICVWGRDEARVTKAGWGEETSLPV